jgi:CRP-like cAMP-binding protein
LLLLFLTGRAYNFNLVFGPYAIYFKVKSDSLFLVSNRLYLFLFHAAVNLSVFPIIATAYFFLPNLPYMNEALSLSLLLFLFELNPFQESEVSHLVRSMFNDDTIEKMSLYMQQKPLLSLLHPSERNRDNTLYLFFTHFAVAWSAGLLYTFFSTLGFHYTGATQALKSASFSERLSALIVLAFAITVCCIVIYNLSRILLATLLLPIKKVAYNALRKKQSHPLQHYNNKEVMRIIEEMPLFSYFSPELLSMIVHRSTLNHYKANTPVIVQGDEGSHLYVALSGSLTVRKHLTNGRVKLISEIHAPSIFGEIAVIDESKRLAEVTANEDCIVLEVPARMLRQMAQDSQYIRELDSFRNAIMVSQFFSSAPVFRDLPENIVHMFTSKGLIQSYLPDQIIFKQGDQADGFYLLLRGSVGVSVNGRPVSRIQQGGFFGEISMIADVPRTATIYAQEHTQILKISRDAFWEILSQNINMAMFIESVGEMRIREDIEILKGKGAKVA